MVHDADVAVEHAEKFQISDGDVGDGSAQETDPVRGGRARDTTLPSHATLRKLSIQSAAPNSCREHLLASAGNQ